MEGSQAGMRSNFCPVSFDKNVFILMLDDAQHMAGDTRYTLFAPTNDAFQSLGIGVATSLLMPTNQDGDQTCYFKFSQIKLK